MEECASASVDVDYVTYVILLHPVLVKIAYSLAFHQVWAIAIRSIVADFSVRVIDIWNIRINDIRVVWDLSSWRRNHRI